MSYLKPVLTAAILAVALTGCESKQENQREKAVEKKADTMEQKADVVRERGEAAADKAEKQDPGMDTSATERAAETARETSERSADQLEEYADREREKK
ncbi:hypothetical protein [Nitrosovibrio sp. Nv6]|uniref:hypothetical protein n=1 Tax=Nitrosovibrio sp. Nv6 TaxID=1855340 RepID=UPI0008C65BB5|nr:hypothetical protein [Nitrosovibrio sp. Nv6]SEO45078.1 hypothetical protein SAMN05216316_0246 [Nitrosovibrio sp. Nv6]